jgi:glucokinase
MNSEPASQPVHAPVDRVIGVDVGGTKVSVAALESGRLSQPLLAATEEGSADALVEQLARQVEEVARSNGAPEAVGVGIPSVIEFETGRVRSSVNVPLEDVALREVLSERLGLPVFVDNDATCAALAEAHDDEGRLDARHLVMLTVGTGVGGGIVIDGHIYRGATGAAGELGHTLIAADLSEGHAPHGHFPQPGSLETLASGRALDAIAVASAAAHPDSALGRAREQGREVAGPDVVAAAHAGDEQARADLALLGARLGVGIANAINTFDPDVVAVGGGVSAAGELLLGPARDTAMRFVLPGVGTRTEIRLARSGPMAGVRGAALLARQELSRSRSLARSAAPSHGQEGHRELTPERA